MMKYFLAAIFLTVTITVVSGLKCFSCLYVEKVKVPGSDKKCDDPLQIKTTVNCNGGDCFKRYGRDDKYGRYMLRGCRPRGRSSLAINTNIFGNVTDSEGYNRFCNQDLCNDVDPSGAVNNQAALASILIAALVTFML